MFDVGVHAAVAEQAEQMELVSAAALHGFERAAAGAGIRRWR